jgi:ABC-2 type transport system ATP-binding protein
MSASQPLVELRGLSKSYGSVTALRDCTLTIKPGEVFGLLGPNGSGKTTLLRLLMGFLRPTGGTATISGRDCYHESVAVHSAVSYLPGDVRLVRGTRPLDILKFFARVRGEREPTRGVRIAERLGLDLSRRVGQMSTGMRQKLALAAVLAANTRLVILDEPTSNLDPTVRGIVIALLQEARAAGRTVIFSSHVLSEIEQACDRVVILRTGQIVHDQEMLHVRRGHRIRASLTAPLPPQPPQILDNVSIAHEAANRIRIDAPGDLAPLLTWLATLPVADVQIEPLGLQSVYEQFHAANAHDEEKSA